MSDNDDVTPTDSEIPNSGLPIGPQPGVNYPIQVLYCGECTMPLEYCEYYPGYEKCKLWLQKNLPDEFERRLKLEGQPTTGSGEEEKKRQKRGGKGVVKTKKKVEKEKKVCMFRSSRGKKKFVTVVTGLKTFDVDLKDASKFFSHKFSCGSSVTGDDEIVIQGDVKDDLLDIITEQWPEIDEDAVDDLGDQSR
ncbi:density-regulated protein homolog isoform X2 [Centruroides vittatus]|nr:density-regulated protein homolog isoform X1 [Centruroides sculpturatus]XP_023218111.1 density-regulated protein homolog isoform X1 [Centruroides sculpturatus]XP_023218112.1 density-regulated protein homolog isoform X1 [Centruroides sculpturatus]XP_023218113.1 density-regulated protein homolog isoform X1 [Centruroides sculpturatus]